jgi:hypothetical protein
VGNQFDAKKSGRHEYFYDAWLVGVGILPIMAGKI